MNSTRRLETLFEAQRAADALLSRALTSPEAMLAFVEILREGREAFHPDEELVEVLSSHPELALSATAIEAILLRADGEDPVARRLRDGLADGGDELLRAISADLATGDGLAQSPSETDLPEPPPHLLHGVDGSGLSLVRPQFLLRTLITAPLVFCLVFALCFDVPAAGGLLHWAAMRGVRPLVWLLPRLGFDPNGLNEREAPPLWFSTEHDHQGSTLTLLEAGALIRGEGWMAREPLAKVVSHGQTRVMEYLLAPGRIGQNGPLPLNELLADAAAAGQLDMVKLLHRHGADVNAPASYRGTALHEAAQHGRDEVVRYLLEQGARLKIAGRENLSSPLQWATRGAHLAVMSRLLAAGADPNGPSRPLGETPLHDAARSGSAKALELLARAGAAVDRRAIQKNPALHLAVLKSLEATRWFLDRGVPVDCRNAWRRRTALHEVAEAGQVEIATHLLDRGAAIDPVDEGGFTPLDLACRRKLPAMAMALLDRKADPRAGRAGGHETLIASAEHGNTKLFERLLFPDSKIDGRVLFAAARSGRRPMVELCLARGADLKLRVESGRTLLHEAVRRGRPAFLSWLLSRGLPLDARDGGGNGVLHEAIRAGNMPALRFLLDRGAEVNVANLAGMTPYLLAAEHPCQSKSMPLLFERGADASRVTTAGETALHQATRWNQPLGVTLALSHGIDANARNHRGESALHLAVLEPSTEVVEILLGHGANPDLRDASGRTPLHWIAGGTSWMRDKFAKRIGILVQAGAHLDLEDGLGRRPLMIAIETVNLPVASQLLELGADPRAGRTEEQSPRVALERELARQSPGETPLPLSRLLPALKAAYERRGWKF